jgi:hypothetical protein
VRLLRLRFLWRCVLGGALLPKTHKFKRRFRELLL